MNTATRSEAVQLVREALNNHLVSVRYSDGNSILPIRHIRRLIVTQTNLVDRLHWSASGKISGDIHAIIEEAARQLSYQRQPVVVDSSGYPIKGQIVPGRNSQYWVHQSLIGTNSEPEN